VPRPLHAGARRHRHEAGRRALGALDARWHPLIERALAWRKEQQEVLGDDVAETQALIRYTLARCGLVEISGEA
jgi:hypothetical protein